MNKLLLDFEWESPEDAQGAELRATWARFTITVNHEPVTRILDFKSRTVRNSVYLPLYPVAEWLATNWWLLRYEMRAPWRPEIHKKYERRHSLRFAGEGFVLPDLLIEPLGSMVRLAWRPYRHPFAPIEFLGQGAVNIEFEQFQDLYGAFIDSVLERLDAFEIEKSSLHEEWTAIKHTDDEEHAFCKTAATLGLDPYAVSERDTADIMSAANELPPEILDEFFSAAEPSHVLTEAKGISAALDMLRKAAPHDLGLTKFQGRFSSMQRRPSATPWNTGYDTARELRRQLDLGEQEFPTVESIVSIFGVSPDQIESMILRPQWPLYRVDAVIDYCGHAFPGFVIPHRYETLRRFAFCRGLFEILTASDMSPALVTRSKTERQKQNRAFAAEFLAPAEALRARVKSEEINYEEIEELAEAFHVSSAVIYYQLLNHKIAHPSTDLDFLY